ncbi:MAG: DUF642 domain-containing protein, partial [Gammaproteobacteria bacterium]|nr:DUF642 domain-containing protein [Gammaproteobacteria bacterium]
NLVVNGGFEQPVVQSGRYVTFQSGQSFEGWQVIGQAGGVSPISGNYTSSGIRFVAREGQQWLDLTGPSASSGAGVEQTVPTIPGQAYDLAFWVGNVSGGPFGTTSTVEVLADGQSLGVARNDQVIAGQQGWGLFRMQVTATGNTMTLAFINRDPPNDNSNGLDAVSLVPARAATAPSPGAAAAPSPGAATAATSGVPQGLSAAETGAVFQAAGFSQRGGQWRSGCDDPTPTYSPGSVDSVADLNGDGRPEAVIVEGGTYCYGNTGLGYWLMSQQADGSWKLMSNGIGIVEILTTKGNAGWPDLSIGGPGFCFPVLRWNGQSYAQHRWEYDRKACSPPR